MFIDITSTIWRHEYRIRRTRGIAIRRSVSRDACDGAGLLRVDDITSCAVRIEAVGYWGYGTLGVWKQTKCFILESLS